MASIEHESSVSRVLDVTTSLLASAYSKAKEWDETYELTTQLQEKAVQLDEHVGLSEKLNKVTEKAKEVDEQYRIRETAKEYLEAGMEKAQQLDSEYKVTETVKEKAALVDEKYGVTDQLKAIDEQYGVTHQLKALDQQYKLTDKSKAFVGGLSNVLLGSQIYKGECELLEGEGLSRTVQVQLYYGEDRKTAQLSVKDDEKPYLFEVKQNSTIELQDNTVHVNASEPLTLKFEQVEQAENFCKVFAKVTQCVSTLPQNGVPA